MGIGWNEGHGLQKFLRGDRTYEVQYAIAREDRDRLCAHGCARPSPGPGRPPAPRPAALACTTPAACAVPLRRKGRARIH